ncbi:MAG: tetratricopeptide repeat protein, partial [Cyanobacteria bacterium J06649_11]
MSKKLIIKNNKKNNRKKNQLFQKFLIVPFYLLLTTSLIAVPIFNNIAPAQAQNNSSLVERGNRLLQKGWVNDAIKVFHQAIKRNPKSIKANLGLANAYNRAGNIDKAWNFYQRVLEIDPNHKSALKKVGLLGTYRTNWQLKGIEALSRLLSLSPSDLEARSLRALLYYYQGRINDSVADYQILLSKNPTPEIRLAAAETFTYANKYQEALELFNSYLSTGKSITKYPAVAYARTLRKTGNPTKAVKVLKAQLTDSNSLDSLAIATRSELSQAYIANNQPTEALAVLKPLRGKANAGLSLARALNEIRKFTNDSTLVEEIANLYQQALTKNTNPSTSLILEVANVFSGLPQKEQTALKLYQQA